MIAGLIFTMDIYRDVWLASATKISFSPGIIIFLPLAALFLIATISVYFRNIAKREEAPEWLITASKYALISIILALLAGHTVVALAVKYHLTAAGYVRTYDRQLSNGRGLWQKWEKVEDRALHQ
jgi:hypothetical protein